MPIYWSNTHNIEVRPSRPVAPEGEPCGSSAHHSGASAPAHAVLSSAAGKTGGDAAADTTVLDGYLEDLQALTRDLSSALARRLPDPIAVRWLTELAHIDAFITAVDCVNGCGRTGVHDMGLDGLLCHPCYLRGETSGPDEDADYEEAAGK